MSLYAEFKQTRYLKRKLKKETEKFINTLVNHQSCQLVFERVSRNSVTVLLLDKEGEDLFSMGPLDFYPGERINLHGLKIKMEYKSDD